LPWLRDFKLSQARAPYRPAKSPLTTTDHLTLFTAASGALVALIAAVAGQPTLQRRP
jgi:hypothetical protein